MIIPLEVIGQNLVVDPSFDQYKRCPTHVTTDITKFPLKFWDVPTSGTPDYFNTCVKEKSISTLKRQLSIREPRTGDGYVGIIARKSLFDSWYEYVQTELTSPLEIGVDYYVEFYIYLYEESMFSASQIGAYFSSKAVDTAIVKVLDVTPQVVTTDNISYTDDWVKISGVFKARGGERYLVIGAFGQRKHFQRTNRKRHPRKRSSYYFIDDVCVTALKEGETYSCSGEEESHQEYTEIHAKKTWQSGEVFTLKNVLFETGSTVLDTSSYQELNEIVNVLIEQKSLNIEISGHTDNVGQEFDNFRLSKNRAKSVRDYIISQGISKDRITYKGYGSKEPVTSNDTVEGRKKNRRVEIRVLE